MSGTFAGKVCGPLGIAPLVLIVLTLAPLASPAGDPSITSQPKSDAASNAEKEYGSAMQKAAATYLASAESAHKQFAEDLRAALKLAMKNEDLAEANAINAKLNSVTADREQSLPASQPLLSIAGRDNRQKPSVEGEYVEEILIEACIDGNAELHISPRGIWWRELGVTKVGLFNGRNYPTYLNGLDWYPEWEKPNEVTGYDRTKIFPMNIGKLDFRFQVMAVGGETNTTSPLEINGIEARDPVVMWDDEAEQVVYIPDSQSGQKWYRIRLFRGSRNGPETKR
jgi:hypothetical protein